MPDAIRTELNLPADARLLRLVQDYVRGLAELAGLPEEEAQSLALGVWEACQHCIEHDFDADDAGAYSLVGELTPAALTLSLLDQGLPYDQGLEPAAPPPAPEADPQSCSPGHGLDLLNHCADEVRWLNHGLEGNELRLTKYLSGVCRLEPAPARAANHQDEACVLGAPDYTIRLLQPGDGLRVAQLMYRVYGYSYSNENFYYPDRLDHDLETGRHVGVVAVTDERRDRRACRYRASGPGAPGRVGATGGGPGPPRPGLAETDGRPAAGRDLAGWVSPAFTARRSPSTPSARRPVKTAGCTFRPSSSWTGRRNSKRSKASIPGWRRRPPRSGKAWSCISNTWQPPGPARVCAPSRHREMLAKIYANLEVPVAFLEPSGPTGFGEVAVHYDKATGVGTIQVNRIGVDTIRGIYQGWQDLSRLAGAAVIGLDLPLAQGGTPYLCDLAEENGFFFSGVRPHFAPDGDFLRLQYLNAELDLERLRLFSPFARELLDYILQERERVRQIQADSNRLKRAIIVRL